MSLKQMEKPKRHAVCVPFPTQGHINPLMHLARALHSQGFYITFVNTEFNHTRLRASQGAELVKGLADFKLETIADGLGEAKHEDIPALCESLRNKCLEPLKELLRRLKQEEEEGQVPPVSCVIADAITSFAGDAAKEMGIPEVQFWTGSSCGFWGFVQFHELAIRGILPFKDEKFVADGTLDMTMDWIDGMKDMRIRDLPSFLRVTNVEDIMFEFLRYEAQNCLKSSSIIINTFEELESDVLNAIMAKNPNVYAIGPLHLLEKHFTNKENSTKLSSSAPPSLWKNDSQCIQWLHKWPPNSVVYVNYGSLTMISEQHLEEFAWGLANSNQPFLWILRPNLIMGESAILPQEFLNEVKDRGYIASWCPQNEVLRHASVGAFLTHCGWNSTIESITEGVPLICWPFFSDQPTNCKYACKDWGIGVEMKQDVKREKVAELVKEVIVGEKGKRMRERSLEWKKKATRAADVGGSSYKDFTRFMKEVLHYDE